MSKLHMYLMSIDFLISVVASQKNSLYFQSLYYHLAFATIIIKNFSETCSFFAEFKHTINTTANVAADV